MSMKLVSCATRTHGYPTEQFHGELRRLLVVRMVWNTVLHSLSVRGKTSRVWATARFCLRKESGGELVREVKAPSTKLNGQLVQNRLSGRDMHKATLCYLFVPKWGRCITSGWCISYNGEYALGLPKKTKVSTPLGEDRTWSRSGAMIEMIITILAGGRDISATERLKRFGSSPDIQKSTARHGGRTRAGALRRSLRDWPTWSCSERFLRHVVHGHAVEGDRSFQLHYWS